MYEKAILHLDLDSFFVECERLHDSALKGKPIIVGGTSRRGVVASCSYEARRFGVRSAMPVYRALQLCPDAVVVKGDYDDYSKQSKTVREIITEAAPLVEAASIDEFYADLTGMDRHIGCVLWAKELREKIIRETGLPLSCGLSVNKTVSKIGTGEAKPNNFQSIQTGLEKAYIAPLPVSKLPYIGQETQQKLVLRGVRTIGTLSEIPPELLQRQFGKNGFSMWQKANGIDHSPVVPFIDQKSISTQRTFQMDSIDIEAMKSQLTQMVIGLAFELREKKKVTSSISVNIRYPDFKTYTIQSKIPYTANDNVLIAQALGLFDKLYNRRVSVRRLGVKLSGLAQGCHQISFFEDTKDIELLKTMDSIRTRFGVSAITRASAMKKGFRSLKV